MRHRQRMRSLDVCTRQSGRWTLTALLLASLAHLAMPAPASALTYTLAPGATYLPSGALPDGALPLTGSFDISPSGICPFPCEPDAYVIRNFVLSTGGDLLSSGVRESISGGLVFSEYAFKVLSDGSVQTGAFAIERTIIDTGTLTDDPHNHTDYQDFVEITLGILLFAEDDPREVVYSDPRGMFPTELTLAYTLIEKTGRALSGYDGTGGIFLNEVEYSQTEFLGITTFTAFPIPEPGTGALVGLGLLGLSAQRRNRRAARRRS